jgi:hypothetical protein
MSRTSSGCTPLCNSACQLIETSPQARALVDKGFVVGSVTNDNDKVITGTGRITPRGEEVLKNPALWEEGNR